MCRKISFCMIVVLLAYCVFGCTKQTNEQAEQTYIKQTDVDKILKIYQETVAEVKANDLQLMQNIINAYEKNGYPAIDSKNQINMAQSEKVEDFCQKVTSKQNAALTMVEVIYDIGLKIYHFRCQDGTVLVERRFYEYQDGTMQFINSAQYEAENWNYTKEGYLLFSGSWYAKDYYVLTLSDAEEHIAFRVQPLDAICRAFNRKYIAPIGYQKNNMFLVDWNAQDYGELNFYDLFDIFFSCITGQDVPYTPDKNLSVGAVYQIPKEEFENTIMTFLDIDSQTLQSKTIYHAEAQTYEYKPRGFYEIEYPEYPYPEVVDYTKNEDGTITLIVNVVFPDRDIAKVFAHEVVVRPLHNGGVQYVSNRIIPSEENYEPMWYKPRLTEEEWAAFYEQQK